MAFTMSLLPESLIFYVGFNSNSTLLTEKNAVNIWTSTVDYSQSAIVYISKHFQKGNKIIVLVHDFGAVSSCIWKPNVSLKYIFYTRDD